MKLIDKIGVIGGGVVGRATARAFIEHAGEIRIYDTVPERATATLRDTLACDLIFVCLPTPSKNSDDRAMACDTSYLDRFFFEMVNGPYKNANFVLRSTVPVGYTRRLSQQGLSNVCHSPEFLTARCSITDAQIPARNIIGVPSTRLDLDDGACKLARLYQSRFPGVSLQVMSSDESETVKLMLNSFFAVKVAYFNEAYSFAKARGLDWDRIREGVLSDGRIAHSHTMVPGPDGKRGYGQACLPKDIQNFINCIEQAGEHATVCHAANARNMMDREAK